jgi:hypothetical protein
MWWPFGLIISVKADGEIRNDLVLHEEVKLG